MAKHQTYVRFAARQNELTCQTSNNDNWIVARSEEEAKTIAEQRAAGKPYTLKQDDDVLDTWFSSALFPFSTMGWPDKVCNS